jgi:hypothetical protein
MTKQVTVFNALHTHTITKTSAFSK